MRAVQVLELKGPDRVGVRDVPEPATSESDVLVEVHAAGVSYPDLLRSQGLYQERSEPPYTLGSELAGVVRKAPAGSGFRPGDRVAGRARGAAAELAVSSADSLVHLPSGLTFPQGAGLVFNYQTAIVALEARGRMRAGETVLVHGAAGGTGTAAIQIAKARSGRTIGVVSSDAKERIAREAGADQVVRSDGPWREEALRLTGGVGVDIVFDPVGGDRMLDTIRSLKPGGRWVVIGFVGGPIPQVPLNRILLRNIDVVGSSFSGYAAQDPQAARWLRDRLSELVSGGLIRPVVGSVHTLENGGAALRELAERRAVGKVVISVR